MKTKLVLWGANAQDEKVLIAMELRAAENKVDIWTFPEKIVTEDFLNLMMQQWRNGESVDFPEGFIHKERELTVSDSLLPDDIKTDRTDLIQRAQSEWHFVVLSSKLNQVYQQDLKMFGETVEALQDYSAEVWGDLKGFWDKVQEQVRERNLFRDHADLLRDGINLLFGKLKDMRSVADNAFETQSKEWHSKMTAAIDDIIARAEGGGRLAGLFDELKGIQRSFREQKMTRDHSNDVWQRIDTAFKSLKEKRFGDGAINEGSASERLDRRLEGLMAAIGKMQDSIDRDRADLEFQQKKVASTDGQLEAQIRQAKIAMIESKIASKDEKLREMLQTKEELEGKLVSQKDRERKREDRAKIDEAKEEAKKAAQEKIAAEIKSRDAKTETTVVAEETPVTPEEPTVVVVEESPASQTESESETVVAEATETANDEPTA